MFEQPEYAFAARGQAVYDLRVVEHTAPVVELAFWQALALADGQDDSAAGASILRPVLAKHSHRKHWLDLHGWTNAALSSVPQQGRPCARRWNSPHTLGFYNPVCV